MCFPRLSCFRSQDKTYLHLHVLSLPLQELIQTSADRLTKLSAKWEEVRGPLVEQYRDLRETAEGRESEATRLLEEMRAMRERMREVADETRAKDSLYKQLVRLK